MPKITSKAQQGFVAGVATGAIRKSGFPPAKARKMLHENRGKLRMLPDYAPPREKTRTSKRSSSRRGSR